MLARSGCGALLVQPWTPTKSRLTRGYARKSVSCQRRARVRAATVVALAFPPELAAGVQPVIDAFAASDVQLRFLAHQLVDFLHLAPSTGAQLLAAGLRDASDRAVTASSDAGLSTGTYAGLATSLQGVVSSTQAFVEALSGAKTLDAEAALLRNAAVGAQAAAALALDGLVQGAPWRAQFVTMLPFLIPLSAAALAAQNAASRSGSGAATGYGTGVIGVGGRAVQQGPIPEEYALLSYDPDVYMKYFLRRPVFALWCAGARLVAPLTPSFSIFVRTTFSAEPACCIQAIRELSMVF